MSNAIPCSVLTWGRSLGKWRCRVCLSREGADPKKPGAGMAGAIRINPMIGDSVSKLLLRDMF